MTPSSCSRSGCSKLLPLFFKPFALAALVSGIAVSSYSQDKFEVYGGYSYFRASIKEGQNDPCLDFCPIQSFPTSQINLNGWEFSGQYKILPFLGGVADFNGTYGKLNGASTREHTYLLGPQISLPFKVSPFAHAMIGIARESQDPFGVCPALTPVACRFSLGSDTSLATAFGGGVDWHVAPFVAVRVFQLDYIRTQLHGATQNQPRASAGIVFHF